MQGTDWNFRVCRVDEIEATGVQGLQEQVKQQRLTLCDDNGVSLPLVLWNEQVSICSLLRLVLCLEYKYFIQSCVCTSLLTLYIIHCTFKCMYVVQPLRT